MQCVMLKLDSSPTVTLQHVFGSHHLRLLSRVAEVRAKRRSSFFGCLFDLITFRLILVFYWTRLWRSLVIEAVIVDVSELVGFRLEIFGLHRRVVHHGRASIELAI